MRKEFLVIGFMLAAFTVEAQTYQRKVRQPAFFMPQSAISTQQQEKLPAIESMNYQGRKAPSVRSQENLVQEKTKVEDNPFRQPNVSAENQTLSPEMKEKDTAVEQNIEENNKPVSEVAAKEIKRQPETEKKPVEAPGAKADNPEDFQSIFAEIMRQHKADLADISKGKTVENPNIVAVTEVFRPKVHKIRDVISY